MGCAQYSRISPEAYEYSKALYSVCNRQDTTRLVTVSEHITAAHAEARLTAEETEWAWQISWQPPKGAIGKWQPWKRRQLMEAQIEGR